MSKKFTKEELEQMEHDPLLDSYQKTLEYYNTHKSTIWSVLAAIVLILVGSVAWYYYSENQENKAQRLLAVAEQELINREYERALKGDDVSLTIGFEQIANSYPNTKAGNLAHYYAAVCEYRFNNNETALSYINDFEVPSGIMGVNALMLKATILEDLGRFEEAAQTFSEAAEWDENESTSPYYLLKAAQNYADAGLMGQVNNIITKIERDYPNSPEATDIKKLVVNG